MTKILVIRGQRVKCYPFMISLDKCDGSCNVVGDLSTKICRASKIKDMDVKVINMITRIYETITLIKHISSDCKCKFSGARCNSNQKWNSDTC